MHFVNSVPKSPLFYSQNLILKFSES